jgi:hypothetical protein
MNVSVLAARLKIFTLFIHDFTSRYETKNAYDDLRFQNRRRP